MEIVHMMTMGVARYVPPTWQDTSGTMLSLSARTCVAMNEGRADYTHMYLSEIEELFESDAMPIDVARREIRLYDYVNHPDERVRDALRQDALAVFQLATKSAVCRAQSVATELDVDFGGIGIKADIKVFVKSIEEKVDTIPSPTTRLRLESEATTLPSLFPSHAPIAAQLRSLYVFTL